MASKRIFTSSKNVSALAKGISLPASMREILPRIGELSGGENLTRLCTDARIASQLIATSNLAK
ncbi:hypothetical protein [Leclercia sp.]|uniref:hypothetical protein n=1 Tax=Leclercia sp. TaxID=1898428 RepID=UPI002FDE710E